MEADPAVRAERPLFPGEKGERARRAALTVDVCREAALRNHGSLQVALANPATTRVEGHRPHARHGIQRPGQCIGRAVVHPADDLEGLSMASYTNDIVGAELLA